MNLKKHTWIGWFNELTYKQLVFMPNNRLQKLHQLCFGGQYSDLEKQELYEKLSTFLEGQKTINNATLLWFELWFSETHEHVVQRSISSERVKQLAVAYGYNSPHATKVQRLNNLANLIQPFKNHNIKAIL